MLAVFIPPAGRDRAESDRLPGATAAQALLKTKDSISRFRGEWFDYRGTKLLATYHPAYLLRNPTAKGEVWKDLQKVMAHLGLKRKKAAR